MRCERVLVIWYRRSHDRLLESSSLFTTRKDQTCLLCRGVVRESPLVTCSADCPIVQRPCGVLSAHHHGRDGCNWRTLSKLRLSQRKPAFASRMSNLQQVSTNRFIIQHQSQENFQVLMQSNLDSVYKVPSFAINNVLRVIVRSQSTE